MNHNLTFSELNSLLISVFDPRPGEATVTLLVDLPDAKLGDHTAWMDRRRIAAEWYTLLCQNLESTPFATVNCCVYPNVGSNNGDLPPFVTLIDSRTRGSERENGGDIPLRELLGDSSVVLAITELSATAPLKVLARELGFRGATLPGFNRRMIPALGLDYEKINDRVMGIKERMDRAQSATIMLSSGGKEYRLDIDLRFSGGHASGGIIRIPGTVANLPSGEAYVVPFEGENERNQSLTGGFLPVQFGEEVVVFRIERNRAIDVEGKGLEAVKQANKLRDEPAYGNIAELGVGVLGDWGVQPVGNTLLDEKLGLHIAFGRSDHFGGKTGPRDFHNPQNVVHIDWVYVPSSQPRIEVNSVLFQYEPEGSELIFKDGKLLV